VRIVVLRSTGRGIAPNYGAPTVDNARWMELWIDETTRFSSGKMGKRINGFIYMYVNGGLNK